MAFSAPLSLALETITLVILPALPSPPTLIFISQPAVNFIKMATKDHFLVKKGQAEDEVVLIDLTNEDFDIIVTGPSHQREVVINLEYKPTERSQPLLQVPSSPKKPVPGPKGLPLSASPPPKPKMPVRDISLAV